MLRAKDKLDGKNINGREIRLISDMKRGSTSPRRERRRFPAFRFPPEKNLPCSRSCSRSKSASRSLRRARVKSRSHTPRCSSRERSSSLSLAIELGEYITAEEMPQVSLCHFLLFSSTLSLSLQIVECKSRVRRIEEAANREKY